MTTTHVSTNNNNNELPHLTPPLSIHPLPVTPSSSSLKPTPTKKTTPPKLTSNDIPLLSSIVTSLPIKTTPIKNTTPISSGDQCAVCGDVAPPTTIFRRHYGVICCEACKCFFRRTVQMGRDYKCRFSGSCSIGRNTINIKQVCQACRFSRCTQAGMKIDSVKKFPRKTKDDKKLSSRKKNQSSSSLLHSLDQPPPLTTPLATDTMPSSNEETPIVKVKHESPADGEGEGYESDFEQFHLNVPLPDLSIYSGVLETNTIPKLFSGESLENIHEKSSIPTPESVDSIERRSPKVLCAGSPNTLTVTTATTKASSPLKIIKQPSPLINAQVVTSSDDPEVVTRLDEVGGASKDLTTPPNFIAKRPAANINWNEMLLKKQRLEDALNHITARQVQVKANLQRLSVQNTSYLSHPNIGGPNLGGSGLTQAPPPGLVRPSLTHIGSMNQDHIPYDHTPYVTPHDTPHGTPVPSPLPSPNLYHPPPALHFTSQPPTPHQGPSSCVQTISQPGTPINGSLPTSPNGYKAAPPNNNNNSGVSSFYYSTQPINYQPTMSGLQPPIDQCSTNVSPSMGGGGGPLYQQHHYSNSSNLHGQLTSYSGVGGVRSGAIGSVPGSTVTSPTLDQDCLLPSFTHDSFGNLAVEDTGQPDPELVNINHSSRRGSLTSAPTSACPSPLLKPSRTLASDAPEAEVEEVLESLKGSIKHMFKWAKSEVKDFDDLSPMDQKALLRRTVPELVMLGFARASIPYDDMLLLGGTGKVMRPSNANSGVSAVAIVTLSKLVVPLKVLNMDDQELRLMREIVLFNPESNCLRDKETVREYRRRKHIELMEYSERNQPGRFGDLLCLLTPLYEVSAEVTEQLRLEQFVHEGEARIDALLLMSMINQGGGVTEEPIEGGESVI